MLAVTRGYAGVTALSNLESGDQMVLTANVPRRTSTTWSMCTWMRCCTQSALTTHTPLLRRAGIMSWRTPRYAQIVSSLLHCQLYSAAALPLAASSASTPHLPGCQQSLDECAPHFLTDVRLS